MVQRSILVLIRECKQFTFNHAMIDIKEKDKELNVFVSLNPEYFEKEKKNVCCQEWLLLKPFNQKWMW